MELRTVENTNSHPPIDQRRALGYTVNRRGKQLTRRYEMSEKLRIVEVEGRTQLYCQYPGQINPQPVYVEIDPEARMLQMRYNPNVGSGQLVEAYHGRLDCTYLPFGVVPTAEAANQMMNALLDQATALADSYVGWWDGSNHVGRWDEDLRLAWERSVEEYAGGSIEQVRVWDAADWFQSSSQLEIAAHYGLTADTTDQGLREISYRMDEEEQCEELDRLEDSLSYCESVRDSLRAARDEEEEAYHASL
jgi:hypothetical protein